MQKSKLERAVNHLVCGFGSMYLLRAVILISVISFLGLTTESSAIDNTQFGWDSKPVIVNVQIDLENEEHEQGVYNILDVVEAHGGLATVFVTGEFASLHPDIIRGIESRGHEIAVHGWQSGEDLSGLSSDEQLTLVQHAFSAVRSAVDNPENVVDFKPQGYAFDSNTISTLQDFEARSISGFFPCDAVSCECWYAQSLGKITFPYPVTTEFWAVPISEIKIDANDVPLDDACTDNSSAFLNYLLARYNQQAETKDSLMIVLHPAITGADEAWLGAISEFLSYVKSNNGKIAGLDSICHFTTYITNFNATAPTEASVNQPITINVTYTSNIWCPKYRFRAYGRYPGQEWNLLDSHCEFVYLGSHSFNLQATIPAPTGNNTYTIRVVGRASFGSCDISDPKWPIYNSYEAGAMKEIEIEVNTRCIPVPGRNIGDHDDKIDLIFVPDDDYGSPADINTWLPGFLGNVDHKIDNRLGGQIPVSGNLNKFNFYYTRDQGSVSSSNSARRSSLPNGLIRDCPFADDIVVLHTTSFGDRSTLGNSPDIYSAEGTNDRSFIHETGHAVFGLADEYDGSPGCTTHYFQPDPNPNIWATEADCRAAATSEGWDPNDCQRFTTCQGDWWKIGTTEYIMDDGTHFNNGWGPPAENRINWVLDQYVDPPQTGSVIILELNITGGDLALLDSGVLPGFPPNYLYGMLDYTAMVFSDDDLLGAYGFGDPRIILAEQGAEPGWLESVDFPLILPYFHNAEVVEIYDSSMELLLSVDISQFTSAALGGTVVDYNGLAVSNAFIQVVGTEEDSTLTDENGHYELIGLQPGNYTVIVSPDPYDNLMPTSTSAALPVGETTTRDFVLNQAGSIAGTVTDSHGDPVPNVNLYLSGFEPPHYATNTHGEYIIPGLSAGTHTINIDAPAVPTSWYILVNGVFVTYGRSVTVNVTFGETSVVDFTQQPHGPNIWVSPSSFGLTASLGETFTEVLTIGNSGIDTLEFQLYDDSGRYVMESIPHGWLDGVTGGTALHMGDDDSRAVAIPFVFSFYGQEFSTIYIGSNGFVDFVYPSPRDYTEDPIPSTDSDNQKLIAVLWDDWAPHYSGSDDVYVKQFADPNRFVVTWNNLLHYGTSSSPSSFQLVLYESGEIQFNYAAMGYTSGVTVGLNDGDGIRYSRHDQIPTSGSSLLFSLQQDWFSESPTSGAVDPCEQTEVIVTIDTTNLDIGGYNAHIIINSSDLDEGVIYIPVALTVISNRPPVADAGPDQLVECAYNTEQGTRVTLDGTGSSDPDGDPLTYTWTGPFDESPAHGPTPTVTLSDGCPGDYVITLVVNDGELESNPDEVVVTVQDPVVAVLYDGDTLLSTAGNPMISANLIATLRDSGGNVLDIDDARVTFTLTAEGVETIVADTNSQDGLAQVVLDLEPAIYKIDMTLDCSAVAASAILVVYNPEGGFATGGGWIVPEDDGLNTHPNVRANFGFNAKYKQDDPTGHLEFRYSDGFIDLKSSSIEQLVITGGKIVQFKGWASVNGKQGYWFFVKAIDNGEPGTNDIFDIKIWAPDISPEGDPSERAGGVLQGGNIVVHTK